MQTLNNPETTRFEIIRTKDLVRNKKYRVFDFFTMTTKYGNKVVASLEGYKYFLPPSYSAALKQFAQCPEDIDCTGWYMQLVGTKANSLETPILHFTVENTIAEGDQSEQAKGEEQAKDIDEVDDVPHTDDEVDDSVETMDEI